MIIDILARLYRHHGWANKAFLDTLAALPENGPAEPRATALKRMRHIEIVGQIFAAHLTGRAHSYLSDSVEETPHLPSLRHDTEACDGWYIDYLSDRDPDTLSEEIAFTFTDGDRGRMSRGEILLHVATHAAIHRGEITQLLSSAGIDAPWDTFAVHLHQIEPARRVAALAKAG
ncbi:DinB family protein [Rhizobium rhizosphaerae]|uniref:DinB family protein n=1 Tax=Xaviernesmea rhizosphaerae TaxID=1672749 RepID=UPI00098FBAED|nr:DinB family protein [Xaviernesmea rhizosphaerae]